MLHSFKKWFVPLCTLLATLSSNPLLGFEDEASDADSLSQDYVFVEDVVSPGDSISRLNVKGSYTQGPDSVYNVEVDPVGNSTLIQIKGFPGDAVLNGGQVVVTPSHEISFGIPYEILNADGGVQGKFNGVAVVGSKRLSPLLDYTTNANVVFLTLQPAFMNSAVSLNEKQVASQLDMANSTVPQLNAILNALLPLSDPSLTSVLDQLSGNQHTVDPFITGILNREFVRRLYDPLRPIVTTMPCCRCEDPCSYGLDVWVEGSWDRAFLQNDGNGFGFNLNGYEFTLGAQTTFCEDWTVGLAGSYAYDYIRYNLGGHGKMDSGFAGLYGLYRPQHWYALLDIAGGYSSNKIHRNIQIGSLNYVADSTAPTCDLIGYLEAGVDLPLCWVLIQPFAGIECNTYWRDRTTEHGAGVLDLIVYERRTTSATSRVGLHITTRPYSTPYSTFSLSIDGAWNCRLTDDDVLFWQSFTGFGNYFADHGTHYNRNSAEGAITLSSQIDETWRAYLQGAGEIWDNASDYSVLVGVQASW